MTFVIDASFSTKKEAELLSKDARFRKTSTNMKLSFLAANQILARHPDIKRSNLAIVLGTSHGELEATNGFLTHLKKTGFARPILFQNSLHNSTLGFISQHFQITGSTITLSNQYFTGEKTLEMAQVLLNDGPETHCLAIGVDSIPENLKSVMQKMYPDDVTLSEGGCGAVLLTQKQHHKENKIQFNLKFNRINYENHLEKNFFFTSYYDSNCIEILARAFLGKKDEDIFLHKPDGTRSHIEFHET